MELTRHRLQIDATPQDVLRALRDERLPFLLVGDWAGGGAIAGSDPRADGPVGNVIPGPDGAVGGGWFGWLGFGMGAHIERLPPPPPRPHPLPLAHARYYDNVLRLDPDGVWWFEALELEGRAAALAARRSELTARLGGAVPERRPFRLHGMTPRAPGYDGHRWAVADTVRRIGEGELFQANVCLRLDGTLEGSALDAFADASAILEPTHGAYVTDGAGHALASFSPELFLRRTGDRALSAPIKGTAPREQDPAVLAASVKDAAEHVMIVDLMRNDLGRVASYGTVHAHAPEIEPHPGLWHLVSRVEADLRPRTTDADLVRAAFPPGSVTGAPKIQSLHVIASLEGTQREIYTGAIGFVSPVAGLELNVAIRTLEVSGRHAWLGAGGGIVADSDPDAELKEALDKARPVLAALGATVPDPAPPRRRRLPPLFDGRRPDPALGLLETMLVVDGEIHRLDEHLARLDGSAAAEGIRLVAGDEAADRGRADAGRGAAGRGAAGVGRADIAAAARDAAEAAGHGRHRLRVVLRPDGSLDVMTAPAGETPAPVSLDPVLIPGGLGDRKWADRRPLDRWQRPTLGLIVDTDGSVLEASTANVFVVEDGAYVTPPADGRILPGVTRARLIAATGATEEEIDLDRLDRADAVLLTSAIALVTPVGPQAEPLARHARSLLSATVARRPDPVPSPARDR